MMIKIFLGVFLLFSFYIVKAQSSCTTALELPIGVTIVDDITGDYQGNCFAPDTADAANWYVYTAGQNGVLHINTNLDANNSETYSNDTRISIYTGTCTDLICYAFNDDYDTDSGQYLADIQVQVVAGETYYIAFDNNWSSLGFQADASFMPFSCFPITGGVTFAQNPDSPDVGVAWMPAINSPIGYEAAWGITGFDPANDEVTIITVTEAQALLSGLDFDTSYDVYIRTLCGDDGTSTWAGPFSFTTVVGPATIPYTFGFENIEISDEGWSSVTVNADGSPWSVDENGAVPAHTGNHFAKAGSYAQPSDAWLFSRALTLNANTEYTLSYYLLRKVLGGSGNINNVTITIGTAATVASQTTILQSFNDYSQDSYVLQTFNFTVPVSDNYDVGFNYTSPPHTGNDFGVIALDDFTVDVTAGLNEKLLDKLSVYPNPANSVITISSPENILINTIIISDLDGRIVRTSEVGNVSEVQVIISDLASGIYLLTVFSDSGFVIKKVIKK